MAELQVIHTNGQEVIDSRLIAERIEIRHTELLRKIKGYGNILENAKLRFQDFFIPHSYKVEGNNKTYECYLLTKQGCEMVGNKLTGKKGVLFTAEYVQAFNHMEEVLTGNNPMLQQLDKRIDLVESTMKSIIDSQPLSGKQLNQISSNITKRLKAIKRNHALKFNRKQSRELRNSFTLAIRGNFNLNHINDSRQNQYEGMLKYIAGWDPKKETITAISQFELF